MFDQLLIAGIFVTLLVSLIFTRWSAVGIFVGAMLLAYFFGLVETSEVLAKGANSGVIPRPKK